MSSISRPLQALSQLALAAAVSEVLAWRMSGKTPPTLHTLGLRLSKDSTADPSSQVDEAERHVINEVLLRWAENQLRRPPALDERSMNVDGEQGRSVALTFDNSTAVRGLVESRRARRGGGRDVSAYISCPSLGHGSIQDARILAYTLLAAADAAEHHIESMLEEQRPSRPGTPRAV